MNFYISFPIFPLGFDASFRSFLSFFNHFEQMNLRKIRHDRYLLRKQSISTSFLKRVLKSQSRNPKATTIRKISYKTLNQAR